MVELVDIVCLMKDIQYRYVIGVLPLIVERVLKLMYLVMLSFSFGTVIAAFTAAALQ